MYDVYVCVYAYVFVCLMYVYVWVSAYGGERTTLRFRLFVLPCLGWNFFLVHCQTHHIAGLGPPGGFAVSPTTSP